MKESEKGQLFVVYSSEDFDLVRRFVAALLEQLTARAAPVDIWMDISELRPGERWHQTIEDAIVNSMGMLVFVSPVLPKSALARQELEIVGKDKDRLIILVVVGHVKSIPSENGKLYSRAYFGDPNDVLSLQYGVDRVVQLIDHWRKKPVVHRKAEDRASAAFRRRGAWSWGGIVVDGAQTEVLCGAIEGNGRNVIKPLASPCQHVHSLALAEQLEQHHTFVVFRLSSCVPLRQFTVQNQLSSPFPGKARR
jgi:hypothetical protein